MHLGDTEAVENGKHVAPEPLHGIGALRDVRFAVAATVVAHEPEVARERRHLVVPHMQVGAERVRQHQHRSPFGPFDLYVNAAAVGLDFRHECFPSAHLPLIVLRQS